MSVNHVSFDKETRCRNPLYQFCWLSVVTVLCCAPVRPIEKYSTSTAKKEQAPTKAAVNIEKGLLLASLKGIPISSTQSPHEDRIRWIPQSNAVPSGKGVWIWHFQYTGLSASQTADLCVKYKIGYVLLKSGNGSSYWGASRNKNLNSRFNEEVVKEFTSRGIQVIAWHYVYTNKIKEQVRAIIEGASVPGVSGMILDAEDEFEHNSGTEARALCDGIREKMPNLFLGYTSFGWVGSHHEFPYTEFDQYCGDAFMPQIYWGDRKGGDPQKSYRQASAMIRTAKLHAPVWMVQSNGDSDGIPKRMVSTLKLNTFFSMAGPFSSLWQWPHRKVPKKLAQFAELHLSNEVAPLAKESH